VYQKSSGRYNSRSPVLTGSGHAKT
jgi:hypothetical protein